MRIRPTTISVIFLVAAGCLFAQTRPVSTKVAEVDKLFQGVWNVVEVSFDKGANFESYETNGLSNELVRVYETYAVDVHDGHRIEFEGIYHVRGADGMNYSEIYYKNLTRMWRVTEQPPYIICQVFHIARHETLEVDRMKIAVTRP